jgi:hypothetical protein
LDKIGIIYTDVPHEVAMSGEAWLYMRQRDTEAGVDNWTSSKRLKEADQELLKTDEEARLPRLLNTVLPNQQTITCTNNRF